MTVCIAAIAQRDLVFGVSDRMITAGDIQFEPESVKILSITSSIMVMFAGDAGLHSEVAQAARLEAHRRIDADDRWLEVREVAEILVAVRNEVKRRGAEAALLQPLGLTTQAFLAGHHSLGVELTRAVATDLIQFPLPSLSWIVAGIDETGAHIYSVHDGHMTCHDQIGFAAIGSGSRHAESQFMLTEHSRDRSIAETLLTAYTAKKRAEVAPGVGNGTDVFIAGPQLGTVDTVHRDIVDRVHEAYEQVRSDEAAALATAKFGMEEYVQQLGKAEPSEQTADSDPHSEQDADLTDDAPA